MTEPEWSRNGDRIVFAGGEWPDLDIYVLTVDGGDVVQLTASPGTDFMPSWSPDGSAIVFASNRSGEFALYIIDSTGANPRALDFGCPVSESRWSPTGEWIAFRGECDENRDIYLIRPDGSETRRLTTHSAEDGEPSWSPDGADVVFSSGRGGQHEVYRMSINGGAPEQHTATPNGYSRRPEWSPDGNWISFGTNRDGNDEVYVMGVDGSDPRNISNHSAREYYSRWSPDGTRIVFTSNRDRRQNAIYIMRADGSSVVRVYPL